METYNLQIFLLSGNEQHILVEVFDYILHHYGDNYDKCQNDLNSWIIQIGYLLEGSNGPIMDGEFDEKVHLYFKAATSYIYRIVSI